jgi:hypothetical protein
VFTPAEDGDVAGLPAAALEAAELEAGETEAAGGTEVELELELELHAAAPASKQAPTAATRHLEPALIRRDIPVKRTIAPCRLSAVNSPVSGPPLHDADCRRRRTELIDQ